MVSVVSVSSRPEAKQVDRATSAPARDRVDVCHARRLFSTIKTSHDACRDPRDCRPPRLCGALCYCRQEEYLIAFCQSGQPLLPGAAGEPDSQSTPGWGDRVI